VRLSRRTLVLATILITFIVPACGGSNGEKGEPHLVRTREDNLLTTLPAHLVALFLTF